MEASRKLKLGPEKGMCRGERASDSVVGLDTHHIVLLLFTRATAGQMRGSTFGDPLVSLMRKKSM
jgi:hypothetical protein